MPAALLVTGDFGGNVPPMVGIARALVGRGWTVEVVGDDRVEERFRGVGAGFTRSTGELYDAVRPRGTLRSIRDLTGLFADRGWGRAAVAAGRRIGADVVVVDTLLVGAVDECERAGLRTVVLGHTLSCYMRKTFGPGPVGAIVRMRGVDPLAALDRADRVLIASDEVFEPDAVRPANEVLVGPVLQEHPRRGEPSERSERPTVLVSLSSTHFPGQQAAMQRILDGLAALPVDVVVTAGRAVDPATLRTGGNTTVLGFVDHADLLPTASLVVGHGGQATTVRALAHGVPMLVVPMHPMMDQPVIGRAVAAAGLGLTLPKHATPGAVRAAAAQILANERMAEAARAFADHLAARDGAEVAADELERLVGGAEPQSLPVRAQASSDSPSAGASSSK